MRAVGLDPVGGEADRFHITTLELVFSWKTAVFGCVVYYV
jgi:hypothetical protein